MLRLLGAFVLAVIIAAGVRWFIENARLRTGNLFQSLPQIPEGEWKW